METFAEHYESMRRTILKCMPGADMELIDQAVCYAKEQHEGQKRKDGSPYIIHPLAVAEIVAEMGLDTDAILGALLHDCIEDTPSTHDEIAKRFGPVVAELVEGGTKLTRVEYSTLEEQQMENLRKMFMAMSKDIRVILIKIADRLHNTRTMQFQSPAKQISKSMETMDIYAPLAHRLGMQKIKWELEDTSLKYLDPDGYNGIVDYLHAHEEEATAFMKSIQSRITTRLSAVGIHGSIYGRIKHVYSIYRKMKDQNKTMEELYDLYAFRVIVDTIPDCYNVLGHIHDLFNLVPGRFKDYISTPKPNMYQSLHTTVIGSQGIPFEVQIRTWEMHQTAEYGIAAHWKYKQGGAGSGDEKSFEWVRRLLESQQDTDAEDYVHSLKVDMFNDEVFVFTPRGNVINLPAGSTPIDFAYSVHTAVGNKMIGARVNGKLVTIDYEIQNGDRIEILTSQNSKGPSRDWLNLVKSTQAKNKINQWFKNEFKEENIVKGKEMLLAYCKAKSINISEIMKPPYMEAQMKKYGFKDWESLLAAVGHGGLKEGQILNRMQELYDKDHPKVLSNEEVLANVAENAQARQMLPRAKSKNGIVVKGIHDVAVRFSKCCSPVPGDEIIGFVTRGRGISIHRTDCVNVINLPESERARLIDAEWEASQENRTDEKYLAEINIYANNRSGLLADISRALTEKNIDILAMNTRTNKQGMATLSASFEIASRDELIRIIDKIRTIDSVIDIERS